MYSEELHKFLKSPLSAFFISIIKKDSEEEKKKEVFNFIVKNKIAYFVELLVEISKNKDIFNIAFNYDDFLRYLKLDLYLVNTAYKKNDILQEYDSFYKYFNENLDRSIGFFVRKNTTVFLHNNIFNFNFQEYLNIFKEFSQENKEIIIVDMIKNKFFFKKEEMNLLYQEIANTKKEYILQMIIKNRKNFSLEIDYLYDKCYKIPNFTDYSLFKDVIDFNNDFYKDRIPYKNDVFFVFALENYKKINLNKSIILNFLKNINIFKFSSNFSIFKDLGFSKIDVHHFFMKKNLLFYDVKNIESIKKIFNDYEFNTDDFILFFKNHNINFFILLYPHLKKEFIKINYESLLANLINDENYRKMTDILVDDIFSKDFCFSIIQKYQNKNIEINILVDKCLDCFNENNTTKENLINIFIGGCRVYDYEKMKIFYEKNIEKGDFIPNFIGNKIPKKLKKNEELFILLLKEFFLEKIKSSQKFIMSEENMTILMKKILNTNDKKIINTVHANIHKINWKHNELIEFLKKNNFELTNKIIKKLNNS